MKTNMRKAFKIILFSLSMVGFGVGVWFATSAIFNIFSNKIDNNYYINPNNKETILLEKSEDVPIKLIEHESNGVYFFGNKGLELINEKIKSDLQFGPEVETIKSIRINNLSILSKNVSGQYNPFTQEMEISISNLINQFNNIPVEEKVELIFPTIFHEYGHHFANNYITSISTNDPRNSKKLYSKFENKSVHKNIPIKFLSSFEESLHYSDSEINNLLSNNNLDVSKVKSARQFYNESNGVNIKNNIEGSDFLKINNFNFKSRIPFRDKSQDFPIRSDKYTYLFSIDELLTRKLQQISYVDKLNGSSIANKSTTFTGTEFINGFSPSTMGYDISKNKKIAWLGGDTYKIGDELNLMDYPYGGTFTSVDGRMHIIESTVDKLWNAYYDVGGYDYGISQIFLENTATQISSTLRNALSRENFDNIKFAGFLDKSKNYKGLLLKNKNGLYEKHNFLKNNYDYKLLGAKSTLLSKERNLSKAQTKFGYTTNYINVTKINLNEPIRVWNDINNNDIVEEFEGEALTISPDRPTTTFRENFVKTFEDGTSHRDIDVVNRNFYEVIKNNNEVFLQIYKVDNKLDIRIASPLPDNSIRGSQNTIYTNITNTNIMLDQRYKDKKR